MGGDFDYVFGGVGIGRLKPGDHGFVDARGVGRIVVVEYFGEARAGMLKRMTQADELRRDRSGLRSAEAHDADAAAAGRSGDGDYGFDSGAGGIAWARVWSRLRIAGGISHAVAFIVGRRCGRRSRWYTPASEECLVRAGKIEFRLRMLINTIIIVMGFWAPWIGLRSAWSGLGPHVSRMEWLAVRVARLELLRFSVAVPLVIGVAALLAVTGAALRICGTAYLGAGTVHSFDMQAGSVVAAGPYRYVRNPLYLGLWFMVAALAFLMSPSGALFAVVLITLFLLRLILGEEAFLSQRIGEPYLAYCCRDFFPSFDTGEREVVPEMRPAPLADLSRSPSSFATGFFSSSGNRVRNST